MAVPVIMPRQGQSVESCIITEWYKKKGEEVKIGDVLFAYETDKASFEAIAETEGILLDIFFNAGDEALVLINVAVIGKADEKTDSFKPGNTTSAASENKQEEEFQLKVETKTETAPLFQNTGETKISPRAKKTAEQKGILYRNISGSGPHGRIIEQDILQTAASNPGMTSLAKEMAAGSGMQAIQGTGVGGRALSSDLTQSASLNNSGYEDKKVSNIRKIIAKAMFDSLQNSAQLTHHMGADVRKLLAFRNEVKTAMDKGSKDNITLNDMICFCVIKALKKMPEMNSHFLGDSIRTFSNVHLGLAIDTPRGLMVPSVRNADDLNLKGLSAHIKTLADSCRKGNVDPELLSGKAASFTVSNLGNYGVEVFTPVINLPQVGILGVNTIMHRPADLGNGVFAFVPYIGLSLTYDHRATDGGPATLFLKEIKTQIENWEEKI